MINVFSVPIFFIIFRETTETSIIVAVLLSFIKKQLGPTNDKVVYRKLQKQVSFFIWSTYISPLTQLGLVWNHNRFPHLSRRRLRAHWSFLWPRKEQMEHF
jgi:high-affinity Fe2+/Pb2+ permease